MIARTGDWVSTMVHDELVMMSVERGQYMGLNAVGARVWELIATPSTLDAICRELTREFKVSLEMCEAQVGEFLSQLERRGAITIDRP